MEAKRVISINQLVIEENDAGLFIVKNSPPRALVIVVIKVISIFIHKPFIISKDTIKPSGP